MDKGIAALEQAGTWETVLCPLDKRFVGLKWAFCIKCKADGVIDKYKVRLVAHGFTQIYGVNYFTTYHYLFTRFKAYELLHDSSYHCAPRLGHGEFRL